MIEEEDIFIFWKILAKTKVNMTEEENIIIVVVSQVNMVTNNEN